MKVIFELWARGFGMIIAGFWPLLLVAVIGGIVLVIKRRWMLAVATWLLTLAVAPYVQIAVWNSTTTATKAWLGRWIGDVGESIVEIQFESASSDQLSGRIVSGDCHVGKRVLGIINGDRMSLMSEDAELFVTLSGDAQSMSGEATGCGSKGKTDRLVFKRSRDREQRTDFRVSTPQGWAPAHLSGRMVWHVASANGTQMPDCGVIMTADPSFALTTSEDYVRSQSEEQFIKLASMSMQGVTIGNWQTDFRFAKQSALHIIYSATVGETRQTSLVLQTIRAGKLYTFSCNAPSDQFPLVYADLLRVADTFEFI